MTEKLKTFLLDIAEVVVFAIAIFLFIYLLLVQPHKIKGNSMQPNFPDGEFLLTDKITYHFNEPKRGDVIVFKAPGTNDEEFIKRIIGLPNERILIKGGKVFINGERLKEPYLDDSVYTFDGAFLEEGKEIVVPEGYFFVMGDNREFSSDSRAWGFVPKKSITGRAWFIYWPPENMGFIKPEVYDL